MEFSHAVSVIPSFHLCIIHSLLSAGIIYFLFRKAKIFSQIFGRNHGIFIKNIDRRVLPVFLNGQDTRHINKFCIISSFKKPPQKIQIFFLHFFAVSGNPEHTVPLINNKNKSLLGLNKNLVKRSF